MLAWTRFFRTHSRIGFSVSALRMMRGPVSGISRIPRIPVILAVVGLSGGCHNAGSMREDHPLAVVDLGQPRELALVAAPKHIAQPGDRLELRAKPTAVTLNPSSATVQADGFIDLEDLGEIPVAGFTLDAVEETLRQRLALWVQEKKISLEEPIQVSVRLDSAGPKRFYVLGKVGKSGFFEWKPGITVLDAVLEAGLRSYSHPQEAYLVRPRPPGEPPAVLAIDWNAITKYGNTTTNYQIFPGDRIIVPGGKEPGILGSLLLPSN